MGKYAMAQHNFLQALRLCDGPLAHRRYELLFNLGHVLLRLKQPESAFECFHTAAQSMYANPLVWLRLAGWFHRSTAFECAHTIHFLSLFGAFMQSAASCRRRSCRATGTSRYTTTWAGALPGTCLLQHLSRNSPYRSPGRSTNRKEEE